MELLLEEVGRCGIFFFFFDGSGWLLGVFLVVMVRCGNFG